MSRRQEISDNLAGVEDRIAGACRAAGRPREDVRLVVVTKTYPASDVALLRDLGITDVGENRHPEAAYKRAELGTVGDDLTWHFVGALQSNKASAVAGYADLVHSVDRARLVSALSRGAQRAEKTLTCLVQVNLEGRAADPHGRSGAAPEEVAALAEQVERADGLRVGGVMAVAPLGADPRAAFDRLAEVCQEVARAHPAATIVSAGMSDDLEEAIAAGATHVRVGRAVLGERPPLG